MKRLEMYFFEINNTQSRKSGQNRSEKGLYNTHCPLQMLLLLEHLPLRWCFSLRRVLPFLSFQGAPPAFVFLKDHIVTGNMIPQFSWVFFLTLGWPGPVDGGVLSTSSREYSALMQQAATANYFYMEFLS